MCIFEDFIPKLAIEISLILFEWIERTFAEIQHRFVWESNGNWINTRWKSGNVKKNKNVPTIAVQLYFNNLPNP